MLLLSSLALAALAYRDLAFWDPGLRELAPLVSWFSESARVAPQLVFVLVAWLLIARRGRLRATAREGGSPAAAPLLLAGALLFLWAHWVGATDLAVLSLIPLVTGAAWLLLGPACARTAAPPLALLVFAVPLPGVLNNAIVYPLQLWTARLAAWLLRGFGITAVREGDVLYLPEQTFEVVETCSGLRSIEILTLLAVTYALFFAVPRLHATLLVASAPVIAFLLNGVRVAGLAANPAAALGRMHVLQGVLAFAVGAVLLYAVDRLLLRVLSPRAAPAAQPTAGRPPAAVGAAVGTRPALALAAVLGIMAAASLLPSPWSHATTDPAPLTLPNGLDGWRAVAGPPVDERFVGSVGFSWWTSRRYERGAEAVTVFLAHDDLRERGRSLVSPKNALPGRGWQVARRGRVELDGVRMESVLARSVGRSVLAHHRHEGADGIAGEVLRSVLALDRSPFRRADGVKLLRLSTEVAPEPDGERRARARLSELFALLQPLLRR